MRVINPTPESLKEVFHGKWPWILVASPYISPEGVKILSKFFIRSETCITRKFEVWFRLSSHDHAAGLTDYNTLLEFLECLRNKRKETSLELRHSDSLHAKIYMTPKSTLVGSSNLTSRGFGTNLEVAVLLDDPDHVEQVEEFVKKIRISLTKIDLEDLREFCNSLPNFGSRPTTQNVERDSIPDIFREPPHFRLPGLR
jgi:phosphatidylserine/phosphatidylglycerophosphate/cardiolipin synthase-like enzyme